MASILLIAIAIAVGLLPLRSAIFTSVILVCLLPLKQMSANPDLINLYDVMLAWLALNISISSRALWTMYKPS